MNQPETCKYTGGSCCWPIDRVVIVRITQKGAKMTNREAYERDCNELEQYREIGTVEECREAAEKQKPKKIIIRDWNPTECPTCGHELSTSLGDGYYKHPTFLKMCPNCGQMIRWSEDLEGMEDE